MQSTQKFDCWEELSDEELASISGGIFPVSASSGLGTVIVDAGKNGLSYNTNGVGGSSYTKINKNGIENGFNQTTVGATGKVGVNF